MRFGLMLAGLLVLAVPVAAQQDVTLTGSPLPDQPFTLIHPAVMSVSGNPGEPVVINHPDMPLQCILTVVPVEDTSWTAEAALASLDEAAIRQSWSDTIPDFAIASKSTTPFQTVAALRYDGGGPTDAEGALSLAHAEAVENGNGYSIDCIYGTAAAEQARPVIDFILANFSTRQDAQPISTLP